MKMRWDLAVEPSNIHYFPSNIHYFPKEQWAKWPHAAWELFNRVMESAYDNLALRGCIGDRMQLDGCLAM
jgi:hypothetical protein